MRVTSLLPLAVAASAFVIPDAQGAQSLQAQLEDQNHPFWDAVDPANIWEELERKFDEAAVLVQDTLDETIESVDELANSAYDTAIDYTNGLEDSFPEIWHDEFETFEEDQEMEDDEFESWDDVEEDRPPHHGGPGHRRPPHKKPHHPPPHHKPSQTVYQLISTNRYTTKLAKLIDDFPDLVKLLNGTEANYTVFAPTDRAFEKIPKHAPEPPKKFLKKLLTYHVSPKFYPARRVLVTRTIPTAYEAEKIGKVPQRLATQVSLRGLTVNFYSRIVILNNFGTNGVIHCVDSILVPPPKVVDIVSMFPGQFSTLELGLRKTGLYDEFNKTRLHKGGTFFAPTNNAFLRLGYKATTFLFSKYGEKYLKALLLYHASTEATLYSDAIYKASDLEVEGCHRIPKGQYHVDLETGLKGKSLSIDIARFGRIIEIRINSYRRVAVSDTIAADGVMHLLNSVLIPPREPGLADYDEDDIRLEDLKAALQPFVDADDAEEEL